MKRLVAALLAALLALTAPFAALAEEGGEGYIVRLRDGTVSALSAEDGVDTLGGGFVSAADANVLEVLVGSGCVEYYEPDVDVTLFSTSDHYYSVPGSDNYQWGLDAVNIDVAWSYGVDLSGVTVAVIDSGIIRAHEDLGGVLEGKDLTAEGYLATTKDYTGHGTAVSGIIAATTDNGLGIAGLAEGVALLPLKCFTNSAQTQLSHVIEAVYTAVERGADVINLSLGTTMKSSALREAVEFASGKGVIIVAAVGNEADALQYPAAFDCVVGVGAIDPDYGASDFSTKNKSLFICAPGSGITSLGSQGYSMYSVSNSGSSFSAPFVSAAAAYCKALRPDMDVYGFMELLKETALDLGAEGYDGQYGWGLLDIGAVVSALKGTVAAFSVARAGRMCRGLAGAA